MSIGVPDNKYFSKIHDLPSFPYFKLLSKQQNKYKYKPKEMSYTGKLGSSHHNETYSGDQKLKKLQSTQNNAKKLIESSVYSVNDTQDRKEIEKVELSTGSNNLSYFSIMKPMLFNGSIPISEHKENIKKATHLKNKFVEDIPVHVLEGESLTNKPHLSKKEVFKLRGSKTMFRELPQKSAQKNKLDGAKFNSERTTYENLLQKQIIRNKYLEENNCKSDDCDFSEDNQRNNANRLVNIQKSVKEFPENNKNISFAQEHSIKVTDYFKMNEVEDVNDPRTCKCKFP